MADETSSEEPKPSAPVATVAAGVPELGKVDEPKIVGPRLLSIQEMAKTLGVTVQWLKYWLVENPVDVGGVPFYVRIGSRSLRFEAKDADRILSHLRTLEAARMGPSITSKAKLASLMANVGGYDHAKAVREAAEQRKQKSKAPQRRVRLPRGKPPDWPK